MYKRKGFGDTTPIPDELLNSVSLLGGKTGGTFLHNKPVNLESTVSRIEVKNEIPFRLEFTQAFIIPGKDYKIRCNGKWHIVTDGTIKISRSELNSLYKLNREYGYSEIIKIICEDGKYIPMECHPDFKEEYKSRKRSSNENDSGILALIGGEYPQEGPSYP